MTKESNDIRVTIGRRIAEIRHERGLSVRQLSEVSGVGFSHIGRIESGRYNFGIDTLNKLAVALGCEILIE